MQAKADARAEKAAKIISLASLLLLFVAVALYTGLSIIGWNAYIAAAALFSAGLAGYPLLTLLTHAVASQTSRSFTRLGSYDRYGSALQSSLPRCKISLNSLQRLTTSSGILPDHRHQDGAWSLQLLCALAALGTSLTGIWTAPDIQVAASTDLQIAVSAQALNMLLLKDWSLLDSCARSMQ